MSKHNFAAIITTVLLSAAGTVHAASPFPSAAPEGSEYSANTPLPAAIIGLTGASSVFPSAAPEGGERNEHYVSRTTPRNHAASSSSMNKSANFIPASGNNVD